MKQSFGPWSTAINTGNHPQLSTFWRRRMLRLPRLVHSRLSVSPGERRLLCTVAILVLVMPLFGVTERSIAKGNEEQNAANEEIRGLIIGWGTIIDKKVVTLLHEISPESLKTNPILKTESPINSLRISPDGKSVAYESDAYIWVGKLDGKVKHALDLDPTGKHRVPKKSIFSIFRTGKERKTQRSNTSLSAILSWSRDSRELIVSRRSVTNREVILNRKQGRRGMTQDWAYQTWRVNLQTGKQTQLTLKSDQYVSDWSPDGEWLLVITGLLNSQIDLVHIDGKQTRRLSGAGYHANARFSPDGKRILFSYSGTERRNGLHAMDLNGKNIKTLFGIMDGDIQVACWSPDGKQVALTMTIRKPVVTKDGQRGITNGGSLTFLVEQDGKNAREIQLPDGVIPAFLDWK